MSGIVEKPTENSEPPSSLPQSSPEKVSDFPISPRIQACIDESIDKRFENLKNKGGGGGGMSDLERRVGSLETDTRAIRDNLHSIGSDVAVIKSNYATKSDISDIKAEIASIKSDIKADIANASLTQTRWMIATLLTVVGLILAIQRYAPAKSELQQPTATQSQPALNQPLPQNTPPATVQQKTP